ncbi:MAG: type I-E CRISPR-associated protein Cas5/CasD [Opitutales bacterium]
MSKYLGLVLKAPLQSWGLSGKFDKRTTYAYPTKSALVGMLCAALGKDKYAEEFDDLSELNSLAYECFLVDDKSKKLKKFRYMTDFHSIAGGLDRGSRIDRLFMMRSADGKIKNDAKITTRDYLQDTTFIVLIGGELDVLEKLSQALKDPKWGVWLGRKSCIASEPICRGLYDTKELALEAIFKQLNAIGADCGIIGELSSAEGGVFDRDDCIFDEVISFRDRKFASRNVIIK